MTTPTPEAPKGLTPTDHIRVHSSDKDVLFWCDEIDGEIATLQAQLAEALKFHPLPTPPHNPVLVAELKALPTSQIIERLRGVYTIPVNDGAGLLDGKDTFTRQYFTGAIQHEAADRLESADQSNADLQAKVAVLVDALTQLLDNKAMTYGVRVNIARAALHSLTSPGEEK